MSFDDGLAELARVAAQSYTFTIVDHTMLHAPVYTAPEAPTQTAAWRTAHRW